MCSKPREHCSAIGRTDSRQGGSDNLPPCTARDRTSAPNLDVQTLQHPGSRRDTVSTASNPDRIDHPDLRTIGSRSDDHVGEPEVTMQEARTGDRTNDGAKLACDRAKRRCIVGRILQTFRHGGTGDVFQFHAVETTRLRRHDLRTADHPGSRHADGGKPSGTTKLTGRLGDAHAVLQCRPRRDRPVLGGPASLAGWFDEPDAAQALLLQTGDGMFRRPGHGRSIAGRSVRVV